MDIKAHNLHNKIIYTVKEKIDNKTDHHQFMTGFPIKQFNHYVNLCSLYT